jgi:hypothetical protein
MRFVFVALAFALSVSSSAAGQATTIGNYDCGQWFTKKVQQKFG